MTSSCPQGALLHHAQYAAPVAALAYVLLPLSGVVAFLFGSTERMRFHGLQAIALGTIWAVLAYEASWLAPIATAIVFVAGALAWLAAMVTALLGVDLRFPGAGALERIAGGGTESRD